MTYTYDSEVHFDDSRGVVFSWLRNDERKAPPVRVEVSREYAEDNWGVEWSNRKKVRAEYEMRRPGFLEPASKAPGGGDLKFRVYKIYNKG